MEWSGADNAPYHSLAHPGPCGNLADVQMRRPLTAVAAAGLSLLALSACRTAPDVAAYIGDEQVSVDELRSAVDERLADPAIAEAAGADEAAYTRRVLTGLVQDEVHTAAAERYGVQVTAADVRGRIDELLAGDDPDQVFAQLASQGLSRQDVSSSVRQQLIRLGIAEEEGMAGALSEDALRQRYEQEKAASAQIDFGYITVPDQRTAAAVEAALEADPSRYEEFAQQFAGTYTLPQVQPRPAGELPGVLSQQAAEAQPGTAFSVPVEETGGIVVGFVAGQTVPTFEELRPQLEQEASGEVEQAAGKLVDDVRKDLDVVVNPRYGDLRDGAVQPADGGVVDILSADG